MIEERYRGDRRDEEGKMKNQRGPEERKIRRVHDVAEKRAEKRAGRG
jgi:hypothetical protein